MIASDKMFFVYNCPILTNVAGDVLRVCINSINAPFEANLNLKAVVLPTPLTTVSDFSVMSCDVSASDVVSLQNTIEQLYVNGVLNSLLIYIIILAAFWYDNKN